MNIEAENHVPCMVIYAICGCLFRYKGALFSNGAYFSEFRLLKFGFRYPKYSVNIADMENLSHFFLTTEARLSVEGKLFHVVHGCNKVMLGNM